MYIAYKVNVSGAFRCRCSAFPVPFPLFGISVCRCRLYDPTLYNITNIITDSNIIIQSGYILIIIVSWYPATAAGRVPDPVII